jgi:hypothetical protein
MIRIDKPNFENDPVWVDIRRRAEDARRILVEQFERGEKPHVDDNLYKEYKPYLLEVFKRKCAYCESTIETQHGDVEHYRPKNRVVDENFRPVMIQHPRSGRVVPHYGYFWLAYDWDNLLLSCVACNQKRRQGNQTQGKGDRFPLKGTYAADWTANTETPLILNPSASTIDPDDHLSVELDDDGRPFLRAKTEEGEMTLQVFGLNRDGLLALRHDAYASAVEALSAYFDAVKTESSRVPEKRRRVNRYWKGDDPYTLVHRAALRRVQAVWATAGIHFDLPLPE